MFSPNEKERRKDKNNVCVSGYIHGIAQVDSIRDRDIIEKRKLDYLQAGLFLIPLNCSKTVRCGVRGQV